MSSSHIAVIGSGISGLSAAWLLSRSRRVTLIEAADRPGGHANTVDCDIDGLDVAVDTGFIVYNPPAYPNLAALFRHLDVPTAPSAMGFSVSMGGGRYEYSGSGPLQLAGGLANLADRGHWLMVRDLFRFLRTASSRLAGHDDLTTLGDFLAAEGYSPAFLDRHLLPMAGAIWSATPDDMRLYPAKAFFAFFENHGLLKLAGRPQWRTVRGGSREYVSKLIRDGRFETRLRTPVSAVRRSANGVRVMAAGGEQTFDAVVIATHADQALAMLADATPMERRVLSAFRYSRNRAVLHRDSGFMPRRRRLWSSWNHVAEASPGTSAEASVTYWMNALQPLPVKTPLFVTLNPGREPRPELQHAQFDYAHPVFDPAAMEARQMLWQLQGAQRTWFCGAHFGAGFHEDGLQAGLAVAERLGRLRRPWRVAKESERIYTKPVYTGDARVPESLDR